MNISSLKALYAKLVGNAKGNISINGNVRIGNNVTIEYTKNGQYVKIDDDDAELLAAQPMDIRIEGPVETLECTSAVTLGVQGDVGELHVTSCDRVTIGGNVKGDVRLTSGDIRCGSIHGKVKVTSGDVHTHGISPVIGLPRNITNDHLDELRFRCKDVVELLRDPCYNEQSKRELVAVHVNELYQYITRTGMVTSR